MASDQSPWSVSEMFLKYSDTIIKHKMTINIIVAMFQLVTNPERPVIFHIEWNKLLATLLNMAKSYPPIFRTTTSYVILTTQTLFLWGHLPMIWRRKYCVCTTDCIDSQLAENLWAVPKWRTKTFRITRLYVRNPVKFISRAINSWGRSDTWKPPTLLGQN